MESKGAQEVEDAKAKLAAVASSIGRDVVVFMRPAAVASTEAGPRLDTDDPPEDFYDLTVADYALLQSNKKEDTYLKTKKIRDAEAEARKSRISKATIRVQFPDSLILEAEFKANDKVAVVIDFLKKAISRPEQPFFIYTTPPKSRIKDYSQTLYAAGLAPSALVYFSHESGKGAMAAEAEAASKGPYLKPEIAELRDLHLVSDTVAESDQSEGKQVEPHSANEAESSAAEAPKPTSTAPRSSGPKIPKWFKR